MLEAIAASGRRNYSLFLRPDGLLIGYFEVDDLDASQRFLAESAAAGRWEAEMSELFPALDGRPDQGLVPLDEIFNLQDQLDRNPLS
jgi:L-rhamnose mutarotase